MMRRMISLAAILLVAFAIQAAAQDGQDQAKAASKTAKFSTVSRNDDAYRSAIDSHDLKAGAALVGKTGSFRGTIAKLYSPRSGTILILNFDADYKNALTAVIKREDFGHFPALSQLEGKEVIVSGKFTEFHGAVEVDMTNVDQIRVVQ